MVIRHLTFPFLQWGHEFAFLPLAILVYFWHRTLQEHNKTYYLYTLGININTPMTVPTRNVKKRTQSMSPMTSISCNSETEDEAAVCKNAIEANNRQTAIKALDYPLPIPKISRGLTKQKWHLWKLLEFLIKNNLLSWNKSFISYKKICELLSMILL